MPVDPNKLCPDCRDFLASLPGLPAGAAAERFCGACRVGFRARNDPDGPDWGRLAASLLVWALAVFGAYHLAGVAVRSF